MLNRDLRSPRWMYCKAVLLAACAVLASSLILLENPSILTAALLLIVAWSCARAYYFVFYVIERYIDPKQRIAGVWDAAKRLAGGGA